MSGRKRTVLSPSLFPFLAVLICTLGTLILMLALVAQDAVDARTSAMAKKAKPNNDVATSKLTHGHPGLTTSTVSSMLEEQEFLVAQYVSFRQEQTAEIEQRRDKIAHVEAHIARVREELARLNREVDFAMSNDGSSKISTEDILQTKKRIAEKEREIEKLSTKGRNQKPRIVIVPHKGPNGTDRRPVYLECTAKGLVIWPEKSVISPEALAGASVGANPIESTLRVIRNHAMTIYGDPVPPYPLLIVRPSGVETYRLARAAMTEYDDQFGYELVPNDTELALSRPDRELKSKIESAIAKAIVKQSHHSLVAQKNNYRKQRRLPVLSASAMDRQSRKNGFSSKRSGNPSMDRYDHRESNPLKSARDYASRQHTGSNVSANPFTSSSMHPNGVQKHHSSGNGNFSPQSSIDPAKRHQWNADLETAAHELQGKASSLDTAADRITDDVLNRLSDSGTRPGDPDSDRSGSENPKTDPPRSEEASTAGSASSSRSPDFPSRSQSGQANSSQSSGAAQPGGSPPIQLDPNAKNWVLPPNVSLGDGNAVVRKIKADCYPQGFVLRSTREASTRHKASSGKSFVINETMPDRAMMDFAVAVHQHIKRWGVALPGGYWSPRVEVTVHPGGRAAFLRLQQWMQHSGIEVLSKPVDPSSSVR